MPLAGSIYNPKNRKKFFSFAKISAVYLCLKSGKNYRHGQIIHFNVKEMAPYKY